MRISVEDGLMIGWMLSSFKAGERSACLAIKSTYLLQNGGEAVLADEPDPVSGDKYRDDDLTQSLLYAADIVPLKPRADVVVLATAYSPDGQMVRRLSVRIKVGPIDKTLMVVGPRAWRRGTSNRLYATEPEPFVSVPVTYENAFGGPSSNKNPVGRGIESNDLPLIEDPRRFVSSALGNIDPAGFGPISPMWQPRVDLVGYYDDRWVKQRWPWFPEEFDYGYFNVAPRDQQIDGYLVGDEEMLFQNLHREHPVYRSRLPSRRLRCFIQESDTKGRQFFGEVALKLDTLWIDLNAEKMVLVWRGHAPARTIQLKEIEQIVAWTEPLAEAPRPASYCHIFVAEQERAEDAEWAIESAEAAAAAEADDAAADAEFARAFAEFDKEMAAADKEITDAAAALEAQILAQKSAMIASGIDPAVFAPKYTSQSPSDVLRAKIKELQAWKPEDAVVLQRHLADVEQLEADEAAMDSDFAATFPSELTRDDVLAAVARRESLAEKDVAGMDLTGQNLGGIDFHEASLRQTILKGANFQKANLTGADLSEADLSEADLTQAILNDARLTGAILTGAKLTDLSLDGTDLSELNLAGIDFSGSSGAGPDFSGSDLTSAKFIGAKLPGVDFSKSKLEGADFRNAEIPRADLDGAYAARIDLEGADLTGASSGATDFTGGNFKGARATGAVFGDARLDRANFSQAILVRAQFPDASLQEAVFDRADLSSAAFEGAVLQRAVLTNANLIRASFDQADLTEADLRGSNLYEAGFWEAILDHTDFRDANIKGTTLA